MRTKYFTQKILFFAATAIALSLVACGKSGGGSATNPLGGYACTSCPAGMSNSLKSVIGRNYSGYPAQERFQVGMDVYGNSGYNYGNYPSGGQIAAQGIFYASQPIMCGGSIGSVLPINRVLTITTVQPGQLYSQYNPSSFAGLIMQVQGTNVQLAFTDNFIQAANSSTYQIGIDGRRYDLAVFKTLQILVNGVYCGQYFLEDGYGT